MKELTLSVKDMPAVGLEADVIKPESFAGKTKKEVLALVVYAGKRRMALSEVFDVNGDIAKNPVEQRIVIDNLSPTLARVGEGMGAGELIVKGDVGYHLGENMTGGRITVQGNAFSWIGTNMRGGEIVISGNAGSYIGASSRGLNEGMQGGRIEVRGNAQTEVGVGLSGGEIEVKGTVNAFAGSYMRGGRIKLGGITERVGYAMLSGEITVEDKQFKAPFYFKPLREEKEFLIYEGDTSFGGKGILKIRK